MPDRTVPTGFNGRGPGGKFAAGNKLARGNPVNRRAQRLRIAYVRAVSPADIAALVGAVVAAAKSGDIAAARELCDRVLGKAVQQDLLERVERLESNLNGVTHGIGE